MLLPLFVGNRRSLRMVAAVGIEPTPSASRVKALPICKAAIRKMVGVAELESATRTLKVCYSAN